MRMAKIVLLQFMLVSVVVIILELLSYIITGRYSHSIGNLKGALFVFLVIILNPLIHERIVVKETKNTEENQIMIKNVLQKYKSKLISEDNNVIEYRASKLYSWDGVITVEIFQESLKVTGPAIIIRKLNL